MITATAYQLPDYAELVAPDAEALAPVVVQQLFGLSP